MTPGRAWGLIRTWSPFGGGHDRNVVRLILGEARRGHGRRAVDAPVRDLRLAQAFGLKPGTDLSGVGRSDHKSTLNNHS